jgi:hypothetical protein
MDPSEVYHNLHVAEMKVHLFDPQDVAQATVIAGETEEPVVSLCGSVRSYGEFSKGIPTDRETCENCKRLLETDE